MTSTDLVDTKKLIPLLKLSHSYSDKTVTALKPKLPEYARGNGIVTITGVVQSVLLYWVAKLLISTENFP